MKTSQAGIDFIKSHEGLRLTTYLDQAGLPTIGYGHLIKPTESNLLNTTITVEQAEALLKNDLIPAETVVNSQIFVPLTQQKYDALVSLVFNIGQGAFTTSTLKGRINNSYDKADIAEAWKRWNKVTINGVLTESTGLTKRRQDEINLYFSLVSTDVKKKSFTDC